MKVKIDFEDAKKLYGIMNLSMPDREDLKIIYVYNDKTPDQFIISVKNGRRVNGIRKYDDGKIHIYRVSDGKFVSWILKPDKSIHKFTRSYHDEVGWLDSGETSLVKDNGKGAKDIADRTEKAFAILKKLLLQTNPSASLASRNQVSCKPTATLAHTFLHDAFGIQPDERLDVKPRCSNRHGEHEIRLQTATENIALTHYPNGTMKWVIDDSFGLALETIVVWPDGRTVSSIASRNPKTGTQGPLHPLPIDPDEAEKWHKRGIQALAALGHRPQQQGWQPGPSKP